MRRNDIILYDEANDRKELDENLKMGESVTAVHKDELTSIIIKYWDCFCLRGARRTILDYEISINTCASPIIYCKRPVYGYYDKYIIMKLIKN